MSLKIDTSAQSYSTKLTKQEQERILHYLDTPRSAKELKQLITFLLTKVANEYDEFELQNTLQVVDKVKSTQLYTIQNVLRKVLERVTGGSIPAGSAKYEELEAYSMSDKDIQDTIGIKPFLYTPDLHKVKHIDELFDKNGRAIILYLTNSLTNGHWIALLKKGNAVLCWDSYGGYSADGQRKWLSHEKLVELGQDQPLLRKLLKESGYMISYNPYPYQSKEPDTNTCGKHCVTRLFHHTLTEDQYRDLIRKSGKTPDEFVVDFVYKRIGK